MSNQILQLKIEQETHIPSRVIGIGIEFDARRAALCLHAPDLLDQVRHEPNDHAEGQRVVSGDEAEILLRHRRGGGGAGSAAAARVIGGRARAAAAEGEAAGAGWAAGGPVSGR